MGFTTQEMKIEDYEEALTLWKRCEGIGLSDADEKCPMTRFLENNKGLCFTTRIEDKLVGTVLCGTDWRRGYLYHLAVAPEARRMGIGKELVQRVFEGLQKLDIRKCHIMVYGNNELGQAFWKQTGWILRPEIAIMSYDVTRTQGDTPC
jgi:ribosomal protein S18 acetylase RimI-like enzyme